MFRALASDSKKPSGSLNLPAHLQRKLKLPRIICRRRLSRAARGTCSRIAQLIDRSHVEPVRQVETIRNHIHLEVLAQIEAPRKPQVNLEESRRDERVAPQIAIASERRSYSRDAESLPAVCQACRRDHERLARDELRSCSRPRSDDRRPSV